MGVPATTGSLMTRIEDMQIGDYIVCNYKAPTSGAVGTFSNLGVHAGTEIPVTGSATPDGTFYFVKVDKGLLIADRVVRHSISWMTLNSNRFIEGRRYYLYDISLLHFDGNFNDEIEGGKWIANGNPSINNEIVKFGSGSLFTPSGSYLSSTNEVYAFGTSDFTIDFWMYYGGSGYSGVSTAHVGSEIGFTIQPDRVWIGNSSDIRDVSASGYYVSGSWAHYALVRSGNDFYYFVNGQLKGTKTVAIGLNSKNMVINGRYYNGYYGGNAYYDEVRISNFARWTSDFTPPTTPYSPTYVNEMRIRSLTGGVAYADANGNSSLTNQNRGGWPLNNEWDKYIVNFPQDLIQSGKTLDDIFHLVRTGAGTVPYTWCQETPINGVLNVNAVAATNLRRTCRVMWSNNNNILSHSLANDNGDYMGFRPVLEYKEV